MSNSRSNPKFSHRCTETGSGMVEFALFLAITGALVIAPFVAVMLPKAFEASGQTGAYEALSSYQHFPMGWMADDGSQTLDAGGKLELQINLMAWQLQKTSQSNVDRSQPPDLRGYCAVLLSFDPSSATTTSSDVLAGVLTDGISVLGTVEALNSCGLKCGTLLVGSGFGLPANVTAEFVRLADTIGGSKKTFHAVAAFNMHDTSIMAVYPGHFEAWDEASATAASETCPDPNQCIAPAPASLPTLPECL